MPRSCARTAAAQVNSKVREGFAASTYLKKGTKELKVVMGGKGFSDSNMQAWCDWMDSDYSSITRCYHDVWVDELDFSNNMLTTEGVRLLLDLLRSKDLKARVLKLYKNRIESATGISEYSQSSVSQSVETETPHVS